MLRSNLIYGSVISSLLCAGAFAQELGASPPPPSNTTTVFGYVVHMDVKTRELAFKTEDGKTLTVLIANDVDFRRLDGRPNKLKTLEKGNKVRVEHERADDGLPVVKNLRARVVDSRLAAERQRGRGTFKGA